MFFGEKGATGPKKSSHYQYCYTSPPISLKVGTQDLPINPKKQENFDSRSDLITLQTKYNQDSARLREELEKIKKENLEFSSRIAELENEREQTLKQQSRNESSMKKEIKSFFRTFSQIHNQKFKNFDEIIDFSTQEIESKNDETKGVIKELCKKYEKLKAKYETLKNENKILKNTLRTKEESEQIKNSKNTKLLEMQILDLSEELTIEKEAHSKENSEKDAKIKDLEKSISDYEENVKTLASLQNEKSSSTKLLEARNVVLTEKLTDSQEELEKRNKENEKLKETISSLENENAEVKARVEILESQLEDMNGQVQRITKEKEELKKAKEQRIKESKSLANELETSKVHSCELQARADTLNEEINELRSQLGNKDQENSAIKEKEEQIESLEKAIDELESNISDQRSEIVELSNAKTQLALSLKNAVSFIEEYEKRTVKMDRELQHATLVNEELKEKYSKEREVEDKSFSDAFDKILDIVPVSVLDLISDLHSLPKSSILLHIVEILIKHSKEANTDVTNDKVKDLEARNLALVAHLHNCIDFMRRASRTQIFCGSDGRTEILQQCARIGRFIDEQNIYLPTKEFSRPSLFEPSQLNDPEKILKIFYDFVPEDQIDQHPWVELYTLFCCVVQVNVMLMSANKLYQDSVNERTRLESENLAIHKQLQDYAIYKKETEDEKKELVRVLAGSAQNTPKNFKELIISVFSSLKNEVEKCKQRLQEEENRYQELQRYSQSEKDGYEHEKMLFCEKATSITKTIEAEMNCIKEEYEDKIDHLQFELSLYKEKQGQFEESIYNSQKNAEDLNARLKELTSSSEEKDQIIESLKEENDATSQEFEAFKEESKKETEEMSVLISKLSAKLSKYKERCKEAESKNMDVMNEVRNRTDSLVSQYGASITRLQNDLEAAKQQLKNQKVIAQPQESEQLKTEIAKLKLAERNMQRKVSNLEALLEKERNSARAKLSTSSIAAKQSLQNAKTEYEEVVNSYRKALVEAVNDPRLSLLPDADLINEFVVRINEMMGKSDVKTFQEALHIKRAIGLSDNESLLEAFHKLNKSLIASDSKVEGLESSIEDMKKKLGANEREIGRLENSRVELNEWNRWAASIYRQVSDLSPPTTKPGAIRFLLEEQILASLGFQAFSKRIDLLRSEKAILTNCDVKNTHARKPIDSLRPVMIAIIFARISQKMSGTASAKLSIVPNVQ